jgi:hypothetical protein
LAESAAVCANTVVAAAQIIAIKIKRFILLSI